MVESYNVWSRQSDRSLPERGSNAGLADHRDERRRGEHRRRALFLPGAVRSPSGAASLFQTYWPGFIVVWLVIYSIAALALSTAESGSRAGRSRIGPSRAGLAAPLSAAARRHAVFQRRPGTFRAGSVARHHRNRTGVLGTGGNRLVAGPGRLRRGDHCRGTRLAYGDHRGRVPRPGGLDGILRRP